MATIACNPAAIRPADRTRYGELMTRLRTAIQTRRELPDGYVFTLDSLWLTLPEIAEWMSLARLCCPFLTLQLSVSGDCEHSSLSVTGPPAAKAVIFSEFAEV